MLAPFVGGGLATLGIMIVVFTVRWVRRHRVRRMTPMRAHYFDSPYHNENEIGTTLIPKVR